jgi:hypothetical protein
MGKLGRPRAKAIPGERFNRLVVIEDAEPLIFSGKPVRQVLCICDCGRKKVVRLDNIRYGRVKSCGCLHDTLPIKHGQAFSGEKTLTYRTWLTMRKRCLNPNSKDYPRYGGRGIQTCERWDDFLLFLEDMGERPSERHSIDRIDTEGDYTPKNCRWATPKQQGRNRRNNRMLTHGGETLCLAEWAERTGISLAAIKCRLDVCGYTVEEALTLPIGAKRRNA